MESKNDKSLKEITIVLFLIYAFVQIQFNDDDTNDAYKQLRSLIFDNDLFDKRIFYMFFKGHTYEIFNQGNFSAANDRCLSVGKTLALIKDNTDLLILQQYMNSIGG